MCDTVAVVQAATRVLGLRAPPENEWELAAAFRKAIKQAHPDMNGSKVAANRVYRAREVLLAALRNPPATSETPRRTAFQTPKVWVRFGEAKPLEAKVFANRSRVGGDCKHIATVAWFQGLQVRVGASEWFNVKSPQRLEYADVCVFCV
ncbi:hypothetical protein FACS1894208_12020 [Clostridia bacterium]|nr:hypothetical protein FACS1894208_12020 [Clostridia bacterium]